MAGNTSRSQQAIRFIVSHCHPRHDAVLACDSLAGEDSDAFSTSRGKALKVTRIAGEDAVAVGSNQHNRGVDRIARPRTADQNARVTAQLFVNWTHIDGWKQSSQVCLSSFSQVSRNFANASARSFAAAASASHDVYTQITQRPQK